MQEKIFTINLNTLSIDKIPNLTKGQDQLLIRYRLVYPRAGKETLDRSQQFIWEGPDMDFTENYEVDQKEGLDKRKLKLDMKAKRFDKRIVFKETISGESLLRIEVLALDKPHKAGAFLTSLFKGAIERAFDYFIGAGGAIDNENSKALLKKVENDWIVGNIDFNEDGKSIQLGVAQIKIDADGKFHDLNKTGDDNVVNADSDLNFTFDLITTEAYKTKEIDPDSFTTSHDRRSHGEVATSKIVLINKDFLNGKIKLDINIEDI